MPVPATLASVAQIYEFNSKFLVRSVAELPAEDWLKRPDGKSNHIAWIVGHVVSTRKSLLARLGVEWTQPWLSLFARGVKCEDNAAYPSADTLVDAWKESSSLLAEALSNVTEETVAQPLTNGPPTTDGKLSGMITFLALHETSHVGQISYLRSWLGHKGLMG